MEPPSSESLINMQAILAAGWLFSFMMNVIVYFMLLRIVRRRSVGEVIVTLKEEPRSSET